MVSQVESPLVIFSATPDISQVIGTQDFNERHAARYGSAARTLSIISRISIFPAAFPYRRRFQNMKTKTLRHRLMLETAPIERYKDALFPLAASGADGGKYVSLGLFISKKRSMSALACLR